MSLTPIESQKLTDMHNWLSRINNTIYGNGNPGLKVDCERNTMFRKFMTWIVGGLLGSGGVTMGIIYLIKHVTT